VSVIVLGDPERPRVSELTHAVRLRGVNAVAIESISMIALAMLSAPVAILIVHAAWAPADWAGFQVQLSKISPVTKILVVPIDDLRSVEDLVTHALEGLRA
jgi:hypothetical protein